MVFQRGTSRVQNPKMSVMSRIEGRGGKMYSFCAMNSLRMSFWMVPEIFFQSAPCFSATTRYIAKIIGAGELIVIDVVMSAERDAVEQPLHVGQRRDVDAALPHFAERQRMVGIAAHQRRQVEGHAQPGAAGGDQFLVAGVGLFGRAEAGELPHRPQLAAVAAWDGCRGCRGTRRAGRYPGRDRCRPRLPRCTGARSTGPRWS